MKLVKLIEYLRDRLKTVNRICYGILALVFVLGGVVGLMGNAHGHAPEHVSGFWARSFYIVEQWPFLWSIFGFIACVLIIILSKWYGHLGIMTREDYYDEKPSPTAEERHE